MTSALRFAFLDALWLFAALAVAVCLSGCGTADVGVYQIKACAEACSVRGLARVTAAECVCRDAADGGVP
jgi:hypothetical protein